MDILSEGLKIAGENKEFAALLGILYMSWKTKTSMQVQHAQCSGKFEVHEIKIESAEATAKEANETSKKAFKCVSQINKKVDTISDSVESLRADYTKYVDDKHSKSLTKQEE